MLVAYSTCADVDETELLCGSKCCALKHPAKQTEYALQNNERLPRTEIQKKITTKNLSHNKQKMTKSAREKKRSTQSEMREMHNKNNRRGQANADSFLETFVHRIRGVE